MTPLVVGLALTLAAPAPKKGEEPPPAKPDGSWVVESFEGPKDGAPPGTITMKFVDGKVAISVSGKGRDEEAAYTVDTSKKPAEIDIKPGTGADKVVLGIFEIKGDAMKICFGKDAGVRPTAFAPDAEKGIVVIHLKRVKADK